MSDTEDFVIVDRPNISSEISKLSTWLQPTAYHDDSSEFHKHLSAHVPGTGDWIEKTPEYQKWHDTDANGILWIKAIAGAGKSVLTASRIAQLQQAEPQAIVLFFFFRQIVTANHESHALVRDWLDQLLPHSPYLQAVLMARQKDRPGDVSEMGFAELWQILTDALLAMPTRVYCVADALDELDASDVNEFLQLLVDLGARKPDRIRILVSSRPLPQIQKVLGGVSTAIPVRLEDRLVNRDIACFVEYQLDQARDIREEVREEIKSAIEDRVFPSFLYARLMLNELLEEPKRASLDTQALHRALKSIPASLEDLYSHMLNDHSLRAGVPRERQMLILQLATHATRPLRLLEIATVLDFLKLNDSQAKQGNVKNLTRMSCGPFLEILPDETVSIIHHSFTEFLIDASRTDHAEMNSNQFPVINGVETDHLMALICVRYLLSGGLATWKRQEANSLFRDPWKDMQHAQLDFPFIEYAACNWYIHTSRLSEVKGELLELLNTFTRPDNPSFLAFVDLVMKLKHNPASLSPLHICAWGNMNGYAKALIQSGHDCNTLDEQKMTPLGRAAAKGFPDMVTLLLEHGATPSPEIDCNGRMPLHYAAQGNYHQVVQLLLEAGANPLVRRSSKYDPPQCCMGVNLKNLQSPLEYACQAGAVESVRAMLPYLAGKDLESALKCSIEARQPKIVKLLVDLPDFDITADRFGQECLVLAVRTRHSQILQLFLDLVVTSGNTPPINNLLWVFCGALEWRDFHLNKLADDEECLDKILQIGYDVNSRLKTGRTALHVCVHAGIPALVKRLLKHGADVHATDQNGNTPLHLLKLDNWSSKTSAPILHALMQSGAQCDRVNTSKSVRTPLHAWCAHHGIGQLDLELLKPYVKDWNISDVEGNTPIHLLLKSGTKKDTLQKLVDLGADPNCRNHKGYAPLHCTRDIDQVRVLLDVGADLETRDYQGRTLFLQKIFTTSNRSKELTQLLGLGANLHAIDYEGNGALHLLCGKPRDAESIRSLLDAGAIPDHRNNKGDTLWHIIMSQTLQYSHTSLVSIVYLLRRAGVPLATRNYDGQTLLHYMCDADVTIPERLLHPVENPIDHLPATEVNDMIEVEDHQGRRPIHLAVARSEALVLWLIRRGATLTGKTRQGENLLHIAAAARASNTIGLLLENYKDDQQRKMVVNETDEHGRTPLHIACRSGRLESVILLLQAGADATRVDKKQETPLHACAGFKRKPRRLNDERFRRQTVLDDEETLRVTEIISILLAHGADPLAQDHLHRAPVELAIDNENEEMAIALADTLPLTPQRPRPDAAQLYLTARDDYIDALVDKLTETTPQNMIRECEQLLKLGAYRVLERLIARGVKMNREDVWHGNKDFLQSLAKWGLTDLFEILGKARGVDNTDWINGSMSRPYDHHRDILPFIFTTAERSVPSLDLLRVIVETFNADVNVRMYENGRNSSLGQKRRNEPGRSVLHILAVGKHWWQTEAIRYLLQHGVDITMRDSEGRTPLHIAVTGSYRRLEIARVLLDHSADPNALDRLGVTPLGLAAGNSEMVQLLLQYGARIELGSKSVLFEAITIQDIDTVRVILESGFDIQRPFKESLAELDVYEKPCFVRSRGEPNDKPSREEVKHQELIQLLLCRPVHYAAHGRFNNAIERHKAVAVVEILLAHGADPFLPYGDRTTIIHDVLNHGGIVEPLLVLPQLELERRNGRGQTLLMAACEVGKEDSTGLGRMVDNLEPHPSASIQKTYAVDLLCEMGADVSVVDDAGNNVMHMLVVPGEHRKPKADKTLSDLIDKCPALIHQQNQNRETPLHLAAKNRQWDEVQILVDSGADPVAPDADGNTILHHLACNLKGSGHKVRWANFRQFLDLGLDINARNNNGSTPLFEYVRTLSSQKSLRGPMMNGLIDAGADLRVQNNEGESLLHMVAKSPTLSSFMARFGGNDRCSDSFTYLMELGLDPFQEDNKQRTPVDVAAVYGKEDILALFKR